MYITVGLALYLFIILLMYWKQPRWFQNTTFVAVFGTLGCVMVAAHFVAMTYKDRVEDTSRTLDVV